MRTSLAVIFVAIMAAFLVGAAANRSDGSAASTDCSVGKAFGFASIRPFPAHTAGLIPASFTSNSRYFARRYNCRGRGVEVRRLGLGQYDLHFPGVNVKTILATAYGDVPVSLTAVPVGDIARIQIFGERRDVSFSVIVF